LIGIIEFHVIHCQVNRLFYFFGVVFIDRVAKVNTYQNIDVTATKDVIEEGGLCFTNVAAYLDCDPFKIYADVTLFKLLICDLVLLH
jgi:hypothetical protein